MGITAVVNQKGGVGKTTVALGLAAELGARGARVLVVDLDPQGNASTGLGVWDPVSTIDSALLADTPGAAAAAVQPAGWDPSTLASVPSVIPASPALAQVEHQLVSDVIGAQDRLGVALHGVTDAFDEVLVDCPPSMGLLTVNALFTADRVVVVTEPAAWSADGVEQILANVSRIALRRNGAPEMAGIVVNRLGRTRDAGYWAGELAGLHPGLVRTSVIRMRAAIAEASAQAAPLHSLTRSGAEEARAEFAALTSELFGALEVDVRAETVVADLRATSPSAGGPSGPASPGGPPVGHL